MNSNRDHSEMPASRDVVNLLDYWRIIIKYRFMVVIIPTLTTVLCICLAFLTTPIYRSEVLMSPIIDQKVGGNFSSLVSKFGGLASLAGINVGGDTGSSKEEALAILKSRKFTIDFIRDNNLMHILFQGKWDIKKNAWKIDDVKDIPTENDAYRLFNKRIRSIIEDKKTGLIRLGIEWRDRALAAQWANSMVDRVNVIMRDRAIIEAKKSIDYLNKELQKTSVVELQQAIYKLIEAQINNIMLANVRDEFSFKVVDPAVPSDEDDFVKPRRFLLILLGIFGGLFISVMFAFIRNYFDTIK